MPRSGGKLIAIEGIDQAGKRTQANFLAARIRKSGMRVFVLNFPDYRTPLGKQLKAYLAGKIPLDVHSVHLLYAANKWEVARRLAQRLERGEVAVINRYSPSNLAYGAAHGLPRDWLASLESQLPKPDVVILLDIPPKVSRVRKRSGRDVHEGNLAYLSKVRREYLRLAKRYGWKVINGAQDANIVQNLVWTKVGPILCH